MKENKLIQLKDQIYTLCQDVGAYQVDNLGRRDLAIDKKTSAVDLVTEVDKKSEEMIIAFIKKDYADHNILAEESGNEDNGSDYTWIIDPVDGTTNYAHGFPIFAISIGLQYKDDLILGCVHLPFFNEFYWSIKGKGAYLFESSTKTNHQLSVSQSPDLESSILSTGFPYNKKTSKHNNLDYFSELVPHLGGVRRSGSACFDLVSVACGRIDGYFEMYLNPWDYRPGQLLVEEAGGKCDARFVR